MAPPTAARAARLTWTACDGRSPDWCAALAECGGGFFHTPAGVSAAAPEGEPFFLELCCDGVRAGVAAGVRHACRFSSRQRHVYLPTLPAFGDTADAQEALRSLRGLLRREGAAEVVVDSFDASWSPAPAGTDARAPRCEYVVAVGPGADAMWGHLGAKHRRKIVGGEKLAWSLRRLRGGEASALLSTVLHAASERAAARGDPFATAAPPRDAIAGAAPDDPWGMTVFAAWDADTPLAAAAVGWANRRAYYVSGGSTPIGYERGAAAWLHWSIMRDLGDRNFVAYNLGGGPAAAAHAEHPAHGLHRFKVGFGALVAERSGLRWELRPSHVGAHRFGGWAGREVLQWLG